MIRALLLLVLFLAFGFLNYKWVNEPIETAAIVDGKSITQIEVSKNILSIVIDESILSDLDLVHTYSRPLFNETRRKFAKPKKPKKQIVNKKVVAEEVVEEVKAALPPDIVLLGVSIVPNKSAALVLDKESNETSWAVLGDLIQDWKLTSVESNKIILSDLNENIEIQLYQGSSNVIASENQQ